MDLTSYAMQGLQSAGESPAIKSSPADRAFRIGVMYRNVGYRGTLKARAGRGHWINIETQSANGRARYGFDFARDEENPTIIGTGRP